MPKKPTNNKSALIIGSGIFLLFAVVVAVFVKVFLMGDVEKRRPQATSVTLLKPPPPPTPKEKPPEPEPEIRRERKMREEILDAGPQRDAPSKASPENDKPVGKNLGVDAEGGAGSDSFGLVGNRGGASLIGGGGTGGGGRGLMAKYGWYAQIVQDDIRGRMQKVLDQDGGMPKDKTSSVVKVVLNERGVVVEYRITSPSGNERFDRAIKQALERLTLRQPPPEGMPRSMNIRVAAQG